MLNSLVSMYVLVATLAVLVWLWIYEHFNARQLERLFYQVALRE